MVEVKRITPSGLGYNCWLVLNKTTILDKIEVPERFGQSKIAHIHPPIRATKHHEELLVKPGEIIAGVRWFE